MMRVTFTQDPNLEGFCHIFITIRSALTHKGRSTHICASKLTRIGSDNGRRQAIIWTNVGILSIETLVSNLTETKFTHCISRKCIWKWKNWNGGNVLPRSQYAKTDNLYNRPMQHGMGNDLSFFVILWRTILLTRLELPMYLFLIQLFQGPLSQKQFNSD